MKAKGVYEYIDPLFGTERIRVSIDRVSARERKNKNRKKKRICLGLWVAVLTRRVIHNPQAI